MGRVLEALRQLESKQGASPAASAAPAFPQAAAAGDDLTPPPEYLPDGLVIRPTGEPTPGLLSPLLSQLASAATPAGPCPEPAWPPGLTVPGVADGDPPGVADNDPPGVAAGAPPSGAYDELAEAVLSQIVPGRPAALWFTSVEERIGRTAMVASLAAALARRESQGVLAVDADFHRPNLGSHFGLSLDPGSTGVLGGQTAWEQAIAATGIPSLFLLAGGLPPADRLVPLLEQWCGRFRLVLVDAPSLMRPETASLARHFHGVYLALRLGRTRQRAMRRALQALDSAGGRLLGGILLTPAPQ